MHKFDAFKQINTKPINRIHLILVAVAIVYAISFPYKLSFNNTAHILWLFSPAF